MSPFKTLIVLFALVFVSSCQEESEEVGIKSKITWNNFCESIDCSEFPEGYITIDITDYRIDDIYEGKVDYQTYNDNRTRFYLPLISSDVEEVVRYGTRVNPSFEKFRRYERFERDRSGKIIRGFNLKSSHFSILSDQKIPELFRFYGLHEKWQKKAGYTGFSLRITIPEEGQTSGGPPISFGYFTQESEKKDRDWYRRNHLKEFNKDFLLYKYTSRSEKEKGAIEYSRTIDGRRITRRGITLVSKVPLLFDRYVYLHCYLDCLIIPIINDGTNTLPLVTVTFSGEASFKAFPHIRVNCDRPEPVPLFECDQGLESYNNIPQALKIIEELVLNLMEKPKRLGAVQ